MSDVEAAGIRTSTAAASRPARLTSACTIRLFLRVPQHNVGRLPLTDGAVLRSSLGPARGRYAAAAGSGPKKWIDDDGTRSDTRAAC